MRAPAFWGASPPSLLAKALGPLGAIYGAATLRRMARTAPRVGVPVICVGNFTVGGAGKTPAAIALAKMLADAGRRVAFLSRGYGGQRRSAPLRVDPLIHNAAQVGDEPLLLARVAPCYVGVDRFACAEEAIRDGADVLLMDDGLQSPALAKTLRLAVVDGAVGFGNGLCLPAGPLRAPVAGQLAFVDAIIVVDPPAGPRMNLEALRAAPMLRARLEPDAVAAAGLIGRRVLAFAGIGAPEKFFATLRGIGANVVATRAFADHAAFRVGVLESLLAEARGRDLTLVTTQKDAMRLPPAFLREVKVLPVMMRFDEPARVAGMLARL